MKKPISDFVSSFDLDGPKKVLFVFFNGVYVCVRERERVVVINYFLKICPLRHSK